MATVTRSRPSASVRQQSSSSNAFPTYQPLTHPLNPVAQHTLQNLSTIHTFNDLKRRLHTAVNHLTEITGDLNDQHQIKKNDHERQKARRAARAKEFEVSSQGAGNAEEEEGSEKRMSDAWRDVDEWTTKMDEGVRRVIDVQARIEAAESALKDLSANIAQGRTATQSTLGASQFRNQSQRPRRGGRRRADDDEDDDNDPENAASDAETPVPGTVDPSANPPGLSVFKDKLLASSTAYASLSLKNRYASHNDYIAFRKI
ncbi:MAG: hypothetical protein Q9222_004178, partial [Ikaeria aurantiellina]